MNFMTDIDMDLFDILISVKTECANAEQSAEEHDEKEG